MTILNAWTGDCFCPKDGTVKKVSLVLDLEKVKIETDLEVHIELWGQDVEHWAGHFGTKFRHEKVKLDIQSSKTPQEKAIEAESRCL
jgi:hypothetical protein